MGREISSPRGEIAAYSTGTFDFLRREVLDRSGMALVLTLMVLALITALVVEFAYGVYTNTVFLHNWQTSKKLSMNANSGVSLAARLINEATKKVYTYPGRIEIPSQDIFSDGTVRVSLVVEDETSKFNLNSLVFPNDKLNELAYKSFMRLLSALSLDEEIADYVTDWIDQNSIPMGAGREEDSKDSWMVSVEELLLVPGVDMEIYDKLKPYVTVFGFKGVMIININGAAKPVIMSLEDKIDEEMAARIISRREINPYKSKGEVNTVPGFEGVLNLPIAIKGQHFLITSTAVSGNGITRSVNCVIDGSGLVKYWEEN
jgi:general secretion pathway protein K